MRPGATRALAVFFVCALCACDDGVIRLSSGPEGPDATTGSPDGSTPNVLADGSVGADGTVAVPDGALGDAGSGDAAHGCLSDLDCPLASLHCDVPSGICVPCVSDVQCTSATLPRCDVASHVCVGCGVSTDCADGGVCDPTSQRCVTPCRDGGCPDDDRTCDSRGYCVSCTGDGGGCTGSSVCDDGTGSCGECADDSHCTGALPYCNRQSDQCVQCLLSSECPVATPVCDPSSWTCVK